MSKTDSHRLLQKQADKRALEFLRAWERGESYRDISLRLGLSIYRVKTIVRRGKDVRNRIKKDAVSI